MIITGRARKAGVMGWPVSHSRSPLLHGHWLERHGIDGVYVPLPVRPEHLEQALRALPVLGFAGCNLTIPHKEAALALVDSVDPLAERIGAVNTVIVGRDGRLEGRNTDAFGFMENLRETLPGWRMDAAPAVVIGAGGAARSVVVALKDAGAPTIRLVNRTLRRARDLASAIAGVSVWLWEDRAEALSHAGLVVNTTSQGMEGQPPLDFPLDRLPRDAVVIDTVYVPLETPLLAAARTRGNPVVDGLGMLLHQARPGFQAWFGIKPEVTPELRAAVLRSLPAP